MAKVTIIDYGVGNLLNVVRAFKAVDVEAEIVADHRQLREASRVVLPGVGAFGVGIAELEKRGFAMEIRDFVKKGNPFLGVCLGMQLLLDIGEEFGLQKGLGLVAGKVVKIPETNSTGESYKVPHIGWSQLIRPSQARWEKGILKGLPELSSVYFVHSYMVQPEDKKVISSYADYHGNIIPASLECGNIHAAQFHPERSSEVGLMILKNFGNL